FRLLFIMLLVGTAVMFTGLSIAVVFDWLNTDQEILGFELLFLGGTFLGSAMYWSAVLWQLDHELPLDRKFAIFITAIFALQLLNFFVL
ncbi:MAG: hypothetical protein VX527_04755, partial [Planctomycetota bacterium]|nr:hypothetical protein [Planctomycetota bacterium]